MRNQVFLFANLDVGISTYSFCPLPFSIAMLMLALLMVESLSRVTSDMPNARAELDIFDEQVRELQAGKDFWSALVRTLHETKKSLGGIL